MADLPTANAKNGVNPIARFLLAAVAVYRYAISPLFPSRCRYYPTCSAYADEAIRRYGVVRGGRLTLRRLFRCHPWGSHGVDPVPDLSNPQSNCCQRKA
ncbi:MAG: membrane protein insertion efficiency factor YidD [Pseudomonadota bacterium]